MDTPRIWQPMRVLWATYLHSSTAHRTILQLKIVADHTLQFSIRQLRRPPTGEMMVAPLKMMHDSNVQLVKVPEAMRQPTSKDPVTMQPFRNTDSIATFSSRSAVADGNVLSVGLFLERCELNSSSS
eukprot:GDKJ01048237.1.p3 GENE.GDKJ01048237.1~~GDKJ01048237.1.p3  ORF type:complete len:127 (-),score=8.81 GDKJ01048237.1:389-769(-)